MFHTRYINRRHAVIGIGASLLAGTTFQAHAKERLARLGYDVHASEPKQVTQTITRDLTRWREVADRARISLD